MAPSFPVASCGPTSEPSSAAQSPSPPTWPTHFCHRPVLPKPGGLSRAPLSALSCGRVILFIAVEILARVIWPSGWTWKVARFGGLLPVAGVAGLVSYRHLSGLLAHYGEERAVVVLGPIAIDGLVLMATGALLAINHRAGAAATPPVRSAPSAAPAPAPVTVVSAPAVPAPVVPAPVVVSPPAPVVTPVPPVAVPAPVAVTPLAPAKPAEPVRRAVGTAPSTIDISVSASDAGTSARFGLHARPGRADPRERIKRRPASRSRSRNSTRVSTWALEWLPASWLRSARSWAMAPPGPPPPTDRPHRSPGDVSKLTVVPEVSTLRVRPRSPRAAPTQPPTGRDDMPHHQIEVHHLAHTCPGNPEPHIIETLAGRIVGTATTGPCAKPQQITHRRRRPDSGLRHHPHPGPSVPRLRCRGHDPRGNDDRPHARNIGNFPSASSASPRRPPRRLYLLEEDWRIVGISGFTVRPPRPARRSPRSRRSPAPRSIAFASWSPTWCWVSPTCRPTSRPTWCGTG